MSLEILLVIATIILFGSSSTIQKYAIKNMKEFSIAQLARNPAWVFAVLVGILGIAAYMAALQIGTFSFIQTALSATIAIPVVAGALIFREKLSVIEWVSVGLIVVGTILYSV